MEQKAFDLIAEKVGAALSRQGFTRVAGEQQEESGSYVLFKGGNTAYSILYNQGKKRFELRSCGLEGGEPDKKWRSVSIWLYDPEVDDITSAESIVNDFVESVSAPKPVAAKPKKKRKKEEEDTNDPIFFFNRFVGIFPELREELNAEREEYSDVRVVTFAKEHLVSRIETLCAQSAKQDAIKRCCELLNDMYANGDMDVRSIITIVILNGIENPAAIENMKPLFSDDLKKSYAAGLKFKGKTVKPEKKKKEKKFIADNLNNMK
ncbi:MAG: DUF4304 domain-containing protein [Eubacteriales bacterium]